MNDQTVSNFGLLDIIAALQWVKENIEAFGGDKDSVTLLGYDTGAVCANFLMISPISRGLFHRAILMSGSALSDWALNYNPQQITMQVAKKLNCPIEDSKLGECLRQKSYHEIMNVSVNAPEFLTIFGPIVDGLVVPSDPNQVMADSESFSRFDLLLGMTEIESLNILGREAIQNGIPQVERDHNIRRYLLNRYDKRPEIAIMSTLKQYTSSRLFMKPKPTSQHEHRDMLLEILSDSRVVAPMSKLNLSDDSHLQLHQIFFDFQSKPASTSHVQTRSATCTSSHITLKLANMQRVRSPFTVRICRSCLALLLVPLDPSRLTSMLMSACCPKRS